jgi:hypothetical protein
VNHFDLARTMPVPVQFMRSMWNRLSLLRARRWELQPKSHTSLDGWWVRVDEGGALAAFHQRQKVAQREGTWADPNC